MLDLFISGERNAPEGSEANSETGAASGDTAQPPAEAKSLKCDE